MESETPQRDLFSDEAELVDCLRDAIIHVYNVDPGLLVLELRNIQRLANEVMSAWIDEDPAKNVSVY
jgi:hypothetical protein